MGSEWDPAAERIALRSLVGSEHLWRLLAEDVFKSDGEPE